MRPIVHADFKGYKFVAAGSRLYYSKMWKTFTDFLSEYIKNILGRDWGKAEIAKPENERHPIIQWYQASCRFQASQEKGDNGIYEAVPSGSMAAYILLAYDLYVLRHHGVLQEELIRRLRQHDQFQGARHELFAAANCIKAGFDIAHEDEKDGSRKHPEFVATHRNTGQVISVEAKSRHRPGVLGMPGIVKKPEEQKADIGRLLRKALQKPTEHPYVIFIDVNLPPKRGHTFTMPWVQDVLRATDIINRDPYKNPDPYNLLVFTKRYCQMLCMRLLLNASSRPHLSA